MTTLEEYRFQDNNDKVSKSLERHKTYQRCKEDVINEHIYVTSFFLWIRLPKLESISEYKTRIRKLGEWQKLPVPEIDDADS